MNQCTSCGFQNVDGSNFCKMCGTKLENNEKQRACSFCGKKAPKGTLFCMACGKPLESSMEVEQKELQPETIRTNGTKVDVKTDIASTPIEASTKIVSKKKSGGKILLFVLIIAIVMVIIGVILLQKNTNKDETNEKEEIKTEQGLKDESKDREQDEEEIKTGQESQQNEEEITMEEPYENQQTTENNMIFEVEDTNYVLPESNTRLLTLIDLQGLTAEECRLARNEIYARYGRKFSDETLRNYFESKDWYQGMIEPEDFDESILNEIEVANRDLIIQYETMQGYR